MSQHHSYELIFDYPFDDNAQIEANHRGFLPNVKIKTTDGRTYVVNFYDPVRLAQDIQEEKIIVEPGLIVVQEITLTSIEAALSYMIRTNYFSHLNPLE